VRGRQGIRYAGLVLQHEIEGDARQQLECFEFSIDLFPREAQKLQRLIGQGAAISLALGYIVARSPDHAHTGQLSTMAQGTGYLIACLGPLGLGLLHSATGSWTVPVLALTAVLAIELIAGLLASRDRHVLAPRRPGGPGS